MADGGSDSQRQTRLSVDDFFRMYGDSGNSDSDPARDVPAGENHGTVLIINGHGAKIVVGVAARRLRHEAAPSRRARWRDLLLDVVREKADELAMTEAQVTELANAMLRENGIVLSLDSLQSTMLARVFTLIAGLKRPALE